MAVAADPSFEIVCEIEPAVRPDLTRVRHQIGVLSAVADRFLIPDNHLGRPTVSSVACAAEVDAMGGRSIACINSRDRNLLGFRRDLLTAAAYGVDSFLLVHGDDPTVGQRTSHLTVHRMMDTVRSCADDPVFAGHPSFQVGVTGRADPDGKPLPAWKREADFLFTQVGFSADRVAAWRDRGEFDGPVYAGVMVLASAAMARRLQAAVPDMAIPDTLVAALDTDPDAGVDAAVALVADLRERGAVEGVHLVPVSRYRQVAARLEAAGYGRPLGRTPPV